MSEEAIRVAKFYDTFSEDDQEAIFRFMMELLPYDDEPLTEEDLEAIRIGEEQFARGEYISLDELNRQCEAEEADSMEDFPMGEAV